MSEILRIITVEKDILRFNPKLDLYSPTGKNTIFPRHLEGLGLRQPRLESLTSRSTSRMNQPPVLTPPADKQGNLATMIQKKR